MKFSMDGFRQQLSSDVSELRDIVEEVVSGKGYDKWELIEAVNAVVQHSNVINCVFQADDPDFTDMSHFEVEPLEHQGGCS